MMFAETYRIMEQPNTPTLSGFDNLVLGTQYALYTNAQHQFIFTVGGTPAIGGTGSPDIANSFSTLTPTVYLGKGFGDLPASMAWLRPVNVTANVGVALPTQLLPACPRHDARTGGPRSPRQSIRTSWRGLRAGIHPPHPDRMTVTEAPAPRGMRPRGGVRVPDALDGPLAGLTTGTVNPGVIWVDRYLQVAVEAVFPVNARLRPRHRRARPGPPLSFRALSRASSSRSSASERACAARAVGWDRAEARRRRQWFDSVRHDNGTPRARSTASRGLTP